MTWNNPQLDAIQQMEYAILNTKTKSTIDVLDMQTATLNHLGIKTGNIPLDKSIKCPDSLHDTVIEVINLIKNGSNIQTAIAECYGCRITFYSKITGTQKEMIKSAKLTRNKNKKPE